MEGLNTNPPASKNLLRHLFEPQGCSLDPRDILNLSLWRHKMTDLIKVRTDSDLPALKNLLTYLSEPEGYSLDPRDILDLSPMDT